MKNNKVKNIAFYGMMTALALIFSYLESFIPVNALIPIPGVKLGFANIVVVFALYMMKPVDAIIIGILRVLLSGLLFGNPMTIAYSLVGCFLSWLVMTLTKNTKLSVVGVSMLGGIMHNRTVDCCRCAYKYGQNCVLYAGSPRGRYGYRACYGLRFKTCY